MSSTQAPFPTALLQSTPGAFPSSTENLPLEQPSISSTQRSVSQALHARKADFTRSYQIRVKVGTWNVAAISATEKDIGRWFVHSEDLADRFSGLTVGEEFRGSKDSLRGSQTLGATHHSSTANSAVSIPSGRNEIGLYVLGLQEVVDISSTTEVLRPYLFSDTHAGSKWKDAIEQVLPPGYQLVAEQQLIGLYLIVYASASVAPTVSSVSTSSVGTGIWHHGNKGAVAARLVLGETTRMVFINCHLAAGTGQLYLQRRNDDAAEIAKQIKFSPVEIDGVQDEVGNGLGEEDVTFWFGDLNYRLDSMPGEDVRRLLMLHTQNKYLAGMETKANVAEQVSEVSSKIAQDEGGDQETRDDQSASNHAIGGHHLFQPSFTQTDLKGGDPSEDPIANPYSLQTTLSSLLPHDELHAQMDIGKAFGGWREGPIRFLPTYKYDVGEVGTFDSSEKQRGPSWCDRILYRTRKDILHYERTVKQNEERKKKDEELNVRGVDDVEAVEQTVFFDYDPETDGTSDAPDMDDGDANGTARSVTVSTNSVSDDKLLLESYDSHQDIVSSDHKPLDAVFTLIYDAVDPKLKAEIHTEVVRELDKAENESRPTVTVLVDHYYDDHELATHDGTNETIEGVDFGKVKYDRKKTRHLSIANTGKVPAKIGFVNRSSAEGELSDVAPPWLSISFDSVGIDKDSSADAQSEHTLQPGDVANVRLVLHIKDATQVRGLNDGSKELNDVLVLRIHNGRDHFLPVHGIWVQSSFGRSVDKLIRVPEGGVRKLLPQGHDDRHGDDGVKWSAPRELFRLTDAVEQLVERSMAEWEMKSEPGDPPWSKAGWPFISLEKDGEEKDGLKDYVWEGLDTDQDFRVYFPPGTENLQKLEAVAEVLLTFLESLEDGIIPVQLWTEIEKGILERERRKISLTKDEERDSILEILSSSSSSSSAHSTSFTLIIFMLARIANEIAPIRQNSANVRSSLDSIGRSSTRTSSSSQEFIRRSEIDGAFATIFAKAMISAPAIITKEKDRKASEARRKAVVELFLRDKWDEGTR